MAPCIPAIRKGTITRNARMGRIKELFESLDDDDDKVVVKGEFLTGLADDGFDRASAEALFAEIDTSQSGRITVAKFDLFAVVRTITAVRARPPQLLLRGLGLQNVFVCRSTDMRTVRHSRAR